MQWLVVAEQSDPSFAPADLLIMTPTSSVEIPAQENLLQKHKERVENLSQPVTCRECILPRDDKSNDPKGWTQGNTKIGPVLEVTTSHLQGKHGVEIRIESLNNDNSHSWVRITHGLNKFVTDLIDKKYDDNEQETSTTKTEVFAIASRFKAKAKPRRPSTTCSSSRIIPILERTWIDIEPGTQIDQAHPAAKKINTLLRHGELPREEDGRILETEGRFLEPI